MPESIRNNTHTIHTEPNNALSGDQILVECRKPSRWETTRASKQHHSFFTIARKNAYAVLTRKFTNQQK